MRTISLIATLALATFADANGGLFSRRARPIIVVPVVAPVYVPPPQPVIFQQRQHYVQPARIVTPYQPVIQVQQHYAPVPVLQQYVQPVQSYCTPAPVVVPQAQYVAPAFAIRRCY